MAVLERARAALSAGQAARALSELALHEARFPRQQLRLEALVLRMEAHLQAGSPGRARAAAREVLSLRAAAPHAARAREVVRQTDWIAD